MPADLDPKRFGYLLKGVADPAAADRAAVKRKAFAASDMSDADQDTLIDNVTRLLARAARAGWTVAQVVAAAGEDAEMGLGDELCSTLPVDVTLVCLRCVKRLWQSCSPRKWRKRSARPRSRPSAAMAI